MPNPPKTHRIAPAILQRSRDFRHPLTPTEAKIWQAVRRRQLGFKFRRQHPIGRFIADFYCAQAKLAIEIDGDSHAPPDQASYDTVRSQWLEGQGYRVIRPAAAQQVEEDLERVVEELREVCEEGRSGRAEGGHGGLAFPQRIEAE